MHRGKQQAAMFLLGAFLFGGGVVAWADRYSSHQTFVSQYGPRARFYDELGLTQQQRATLDSLSFEQDCAVKSVLAPHDSALKAIKTNFKAQWRNVFTKEQLAKYDARDKEIRARRDAERQKEPKRTCSGN